MRPAEQPEDRRAEAASGRQGGDRKAPEGRHRGEAQVRFYVAKSEGRHRAS